ncbi:hypothetical protein GEV33_010121 [Tenebrio molitor]|uniref:Endonuclease/exonuclease/phosphatase domain-containing protein n=1 Tax=Tenebrio molitor TaxID=7067 RepID=A0A8J6HDI3_TENMO|nr:hypothetical protein GEV33_010121 [Tenebrio molitor]
MDFKWDEERCQSVKRKKLKGTEMTRLRYSQEAEPNQQTTEMQFFDARKRTVVDMSKEMDAGGNPYKKKESPRAVNVAEAVDAVMRMAGIMDKVLKASYHPKAELNQVPGTGHNQRGMGGSEADDPTGGGGADPWKVFRISHTAHERPEMVKVILFDKFDGTAHREGKGTRVTRRRKAIEWSARAKNRAGKSGRGGYHVQRSDTNDKEDLNRKTAVSSKKRCGADLATEGAVGREDGKFKRQDRGKKRQYKDDVEGHIKQPLMRPCQEGNKVAVALAKKLVQKWKICVGLAVCGHLMVQQQTDVVLVSELDGQRGRTAIMNRTMSCYIISPNCMLAEFKRYFDHLQDDIRSKGGEVLLGGDFNSWLANSCTSQSATRGLYGPLLIRHAGLQVRWFSGAERWTGSTVQLFAGCCGSPMRRSGGDGARLLPGWLEVPAGSHEVVRCCWFAGGDILAEEEDKTLGRWILTDDVLSDDTWYQKDRRSYHHRLRWRFPQGRRPLEGGARERGLEERRSGKAAPDGV